MAYEVESHKCYRAECACGNGYVQYEEITESNDWGHVHTRYTPMEIMCDSCRQTHYYYSPDGTSGDPKYHLEKYLVPHGISHPGEPPKCKKLSPSEEFIQNSTKFDNDQRAFHSNSKTLHFECVSGSQRNVDTTVEYDLSFYKDVTNRYWDTLYIKECIDPHFICQKKNTLLPETIVAKQYLCQCTVCNKEIEISSADFTIKHIDGDRYFPVAYCPCRKNNSGDYKSSAEAKAMDILNKLDVPYMREYAFDGLVGDANKPLLFDFAIYTTDTEKFTPEIKLLIELQGPHHYNPGKYEENTYVTADLNANEQFTAERKFERQSRYDRKKAAFCQQRSIPLECIKYTISKSYTKLQVTLFEILQKYGCNANSNHLSK